MSRALSSALQGLALLLLLGCDAATTATLETGTDFSFVVASQAISLPPGGQASAGIPISWVGCPARPVQLTLEGAPPGLSGAFDVNPTPDGNTLTLSAMAGMAPGTHTLRVLGANGSLTHSREISVTIPATPDFSLVVQPAYLNLAQGGGASATVTIQRSANFSGPVDLSLEGGPAGISAHFGGGPGDSSRILTLTAGLTAPPGTFALTLKGTSAGKVRSTGLALTLTPNTDFALSLNPPSLTVLFGTPAAGLAVAIQRAPGYTAAVNLSLEGAPAGLTGLFNPAITTGNASSLGLTLASLSPATYSLAVRGDSGGASRWAPFSLTVLPPAPDFSLPTLSFSLVQGTSGTRPVTITAQGAFASPVLLSLEGAPAGVTSGFTPNPATPAQGSSLTLNVGAAVPPGDYNLMLRGLSGALNHTAPVTLKVLASADFSLSLGAPNVSLAIPLGGTPVSTSQAVSITPTGGFNGPVTLTLEGAPVGVTGSFLPNPATTSSTLTLTVAATALPGTTLLTVRGRDGAGVLDHTAALQLTLTAGVDFGLTLGAPSVSVMIPNSGTASGSTTATITPLGAFAGAVNLSVLAPLPTGVTSNFNPNPVNSGASTLTFSVAPTASAGTYPLTVQGTSGSLVHLVPVSLVLLAPLVPDFSVTPQLAAVAGVPGSVGSLDVDVNSIDGFSGAVTLALQGAPAGMTATFAPPAPNVPLGGTASSTMTKTIGAAVAEGIYNVNIRGTAGILVRNGPLQVTVQGYSISVSQNLFNPAPFGTPFTTTLTLSRLFGYAGTVTLQPAIFSGFMVNPTVTYSANPLSGGTTISTVSITLPGQSPGSGTITIAATGAPTNFSRLLVITLMW